MKFTEWMTKNWDKGNMLPPPLSSQEAINFLQKYLLGENWYVINPMTASQTNVEIVHNILYKHSRKYRKEFKKYAKNIRRN